jgi:hypothetical protein
MATSRPHEKHFVSQVRSMRTTIGSVARSSSCKPAMRSIAVMMIERSSMFAKLQDDAKKTGGRVIPMLGNHELMNASLDFRYVTPGGFEAFADVAAKDPATAARIASLDPRERGRAAAFLPGGVYATLLSHRPVIVQVGDTVFVHGGVAPKHVAYGIATLNDEVSAWLLGRAPSLPQMATAEDGPLWTRAYSAAPGPEECAMLSKTLDAMNAKRMVMGHTVQRGGISSACDGKAWRIDVGMTHVYGGPVQVLSIAHDEVVVRKGG